MGKDLEIIFENDEFVAINKPHGLLVHRTSMAPNETNFALQILRDQLGQIVHPAHRIDRKTSGVLLFSKSRQTNKMIQSLFRDKKVTKYYLAIVRGYVPASGSIDYDLTLEGKTQSAITNFSSLQKYELPIPSHQFATSRYSLIQIHPQTGRHHQIRRHLAHIMHPIIGDRPHGCNKQNRLWKEHFHLTTMMLHAQSIEFEIPDSGIVKIDANLSPQFSQALTILRQNNISASWDPEPT